MEKISKISAALGRSSFNILLITENILSLNQAQRDEYHIDGLIQINGVMIPPSP